MNTDDLPRGEYDPSTRKLRLWNCASREDETQAAKRRIEQLTTQLTCSHGLTRKERRQLDKERNVWQRQYFPSAQETPKAARKAKAIEKKLRWLTKRAEQRPLPVKQKSA